MDTTKLTDKAQVAADRGNYDYAVDLYLQLLEFQPNHTEARKKLREVEVRKFQELGVTKSNPAVYLTGLGSLLGALVFGVIRKYDKAMSACEAFLKKDPYNAFVLTQLARAAAGAGQKDTAVLVYEDIRSRLGSPKNKMAQRSHISRLRALGGLYAEGGDYVKAAECAEEIIRYRPTDRDAQKNIRDWAARRSIVTGRWDEAQKLGYRTALENEDKSQSLEDSHRDIRTREDVDGAIRRVTADLQADPQSTRLLIQLGEYHQMNQVWEKARGCYLKAQEIDPSNFLVQQKLGDLRLAEMDEQIKTLASAEATRAQAASLKAERTQFALAEYQRRAKARPQDFPTRYKLASILYQLKKYHEAAIQFQHASKDPRHRQAATFRFGLCLQKQGMIDLAIEQYRRAAHGASIIGLEIKNILYTLGRAYEGQGRLPEALDAYKRVFDADMDFRDVSARIEELYKKGAKSAV